MLLVRAGLCGTHAGTSFCGWPGSSAAVAGRAATAWWSLEQGCFWGLGVRRAYGASAGRVAGRGAGPAQAGAVLQERDVRPAVRVGVDAEVVEQLAAARAADSALAHGPAVDGHQPVRRTPARGGPGHVLRRNRRTRSGWPRWVRRSTRGLRSCWSRPATGKSLARVLVLTGRGALPRLPRRRPRGRVAERPAVTDSGNILSSGAGRAA